MQSLILYSLISLFGIAQVWQGIKTLLTQQFTYKKRTGQFPSQAEDVHQRGLAAKVASLHLIISGCVLLLLVIATIFEIVPIDWLFLIAIGVVWLFSFSGYIVSSRMGK